MDELKNIYYSCYLVFTDIEIAGIIKLSFAII